VPKEQSFKCIGPTFVLLEEGLAKLYEKKYVGLKTFSKWIIAYMT